MLHPRIPKSTFASFSLLLNQCESDELATEGKQRENAVSGRNRRWHQRLSERVGLELGRFIMCKDVTSLYLRVQSLSGYARAHWDAEAMAAEPRRSCIVVQRTEGA